MICVVLAVIAGVGYLVYAGRRPTTNTPGVSQQIWTDYATAYDAAHQNLPSPDTIRQKADACIAGLPGTGALGQGNPGYGSTDSLGRATVAWVCLGSPVAVSEQRCNYPAGTTRATYVGWVQGHLVSYRLGGDGTRRDSRGCVNIVPETGSVNTRIYQGPETWALAHPNIFYIAVPHYRADESLSPEDAGKPDQLYYFAFSETGAAPVAAWTFSNF